MFKGNIYENLSKLPKFVQENPVRVLFYLALVLGAIIRVWLSFLTTGNYHPDEVYQSVEPAHYLSFGYAWLPPEFMNEVQNEQYYGRSRSWAFPLIFSGIMNLGEFLNLQYQQQTLRLIYLSGGISSILLVLVVKYFISLYTKNKTMGYSAGIFVALWWRGIHLSMRLFTNTFILPALLLGLAISIQSVRTKKSPNPFQSFFIMVGVGLCTYVRSDFLILVFVVAMSEFIGHKGMRVHLKLDRAKQFGAILFLSILGWIIGMTIDFNLYKSDSFQDFFAVPLNWIGFNFIEGKSENFGVTPFGTYFANLIFLDGLVVSILVFLGLFSFFLYLKYKKRLNSESTQSMPNGGKELILLVKLSVVVICAWMLYEFPLSFSSHKEFRFITNVLILMLALFGCYSYVVFRFLHEYSKGARFTIGKYQFSVNKSEAKIYRRLLQVVFIVLLLLQSLSAFGRFPQESGGDFQDAFYWISKNGKNASGVIVVNPWYYTGAYSQLHKNITLYFIENKYLNANFFFVYLKNFYIVLHVNSHNSHTGILQTLENSNWNKEITLATTIEIWFKT